MLAAVAGGFVWASVAQPMPNVHPIADVPERRATRADRRHAGRPLDEWRRVMKELVPADPASVVYVPGMIALVRDADVPAITRRQAALTLGRIGRPAAEAAVPVLVELLSVDEQGDDDRELAASLWAIKALALFGPEARSAAPRLAQLLADDARPTGERLASIEALARIGAAHPAVIPALVDALAFRARDGRAEAERTAAEFRGLAAQALGSIGPPAASAIPALVRAVDDEDELVRRQVITALGGMETEAAPAISTLANAMAFDESPAVRDAAAGALGRIGAPATRLLAHLLEDRDEALRLRAAATLGAMREAARPALPALEHALADTSPAVRLSAAEAIWKVGEQADLAAPVALDSLSSRDRQLRIAASRLLVEMAPHEPQVRESLRRLATSDDPRLRRAAEETLEKIERTATEAK